VAPDATVLEQVPAEAQKATWQLSLAVQPDGDPGVQAAPHMPAVMDPETHSPDALHVWGVVPLHCVAAGEQSPVHSPAVQRYAHGVQPLPHALGSV
jgi:hypothetical protein